jgi:hypothetical protein
MRLRDFFGGQVDPNALLGILPVRPDGGFIDDVDHFMSDEMRRACPAVLNTIVEVEVKSDGRIEVKGHADWHSNESLYKAVRLHIDCGPSPYKPLRRRFPDSLVIATTLDIIFADRSGGGSSEQPPEPGEARESGEHSPGGACESGLSSHKCGQRSDENCDMITGIWKFLRRENGDNPMRGKQLHRLTPYLHLRPLEGWYQAIRAAQETLNKEYPDDI